MPGVSYPTPAHEQAAAEITSFFASRKETDAVLLVCSCARGKATVDSCLDMQVVAPADAVPELASAFRRFEAGSDAIAELLRAGRFSDLHLDVIDGTFVPGVIDEEDMWIREQIAENLGLPAVYEQLPRLFELDRFESRALEAKAEELRRLTEDYVVVD